MPIYNGITNPFKTALLEWPGDWQKNARGELWTSVPLLYTVGRGQCQSLEPRRTAWATDAIWLPNV